MKKGLHLLSAFVLLMSCWSSVVLAQGVTTASMRGRVTEQNGEPLPGATIVAVHEPSGTRYGTATRENGDYNIPGMRVGGPYTVTVTFIGFDEQRRENITLSLGTTANVDFRVGESTQQLAEVQVIGTRNDVFSSERTGAATNISNEAINSLPTIGRTINDFTRLTPQSSGNSFGGADNRFNNITIDGSIFNNSFGLGDQPGARTGTSAISLDAIEEIQVSLAPFDVRQAGFVGAGINAITRSGTNEFSGSVFYNVQSEALVGRRALEQEVPVNEFRNRQVGFRLGGPIVKNKLFFFINGELEKRTEPATPFRANRGGEPVAGNVTRVLASDLDQLSSFLSENFGYETGPYEGYENETRGDKFLAKLDYNVNENHRVSLRYTMLDAERDVLLSNSSSLGFGSRRSRPQSLNFRNSNYIQTEKIQSVIGEVNSNFGTRFSNNLIVGYTFQSEDRGSRGNFFPLVEILDGNQNYTTFGFEPFTPNNQLSYSTIQFQNNFTAYMGQHTVTAGVNLERFSYENVFFPGSQSVYVYNSLEDFYTDANGFLANPNRTTSPVELRRFQLRYENQNIIAPGEDPVQPTKVWYPGAYLQDEFQALPNLRLTGGLRIDIPIFEDTGFENPIVNDLTFSRSGNPNTDPLRVSTSQLPEANVLFSPRFGFNYDVFDNKRLQIRGGTGIFTGRPVFVWISNQIGNNGILTGFDQLDDTNERPFNPDPRAYVPQEANLPPTAELALTDPDFRFPQIWRSNLAVDVQLPFGVIATLEGIYSKDVNAIEYLNVNLKDSLVGNTNEIARFNGPDNRPIYNGAAGSRINPYAINAIYLTNTDQGYAYSLTAQLQKSFQTGLFVQAAYTFGESFATINPGSIAAGSWNGRATVNGGNRPDLSFSNNDQRHRAIGAVSWRREQGDFGAFQVSLFYEARNQGRFSYTVSGDMNRDGINNNDLVYVPAVGEEVRFRPITTGSGDNQVVLFTPADQAAAFEAYIQQDEYLSSRRGQYAERNGGIFPWVYRADFSLIQELFFKIPNTQQRNTLQLRVDIFNVGNLLNTDWGVGHRTFANQPLIAAGVSADGVPEYRFQRVGGQLLSQTFDRTASLADTWSLQAGIRYIFN